MELPIFNDNLKSSGSWSAALVMEQEKWKQSGASAKSLREYQAEHLLHGTDGLDRANLLKAADKVASWAAESEAKFTSERLLELTRAPGTEVNDRSIDLAVSRLRGKLDVPRERFISFPAAERADDTSRVIGWAGWDPVQRATALMNLFHERKAQEAWPPERLALLLRGVRELGFWLKLWHNQPSADFDGERPGDLFERLLDAEARVIGFTPEALDHIQLPDQKPPRPAPRRRGEAAS